MARGVIYVMTTVVPGLIKIGKTGTANYESRMYNLEHNGYSNVVGLKRYFAIELDEYDKKEVLIHTLFSKSRLENTELFALDVNLVVELLSSFEGKKIYPENATKQEVFEEANEMRGIRSVPNGTYYFKRKIKRWDNREVTGTMRVENGLFIVLPGSVVCPQEAEGMHYALVLDKRASASIKNDVLQEEVTFSTPSAAASFLIGGAVNGWSDWKTDKGEPIDIYRSEQQ